MTLVVVRKKVLNIRCLWVLSLFFGFVVLAGCEKKQSYTPPPPPKVTVANPVVQDVMDSVDYTGTLSAVKSVQIRARVEGFLDKIHFVDGSIVEKGELLFTIDPKPLQAQLEEANAQLQSCRADLKLAEATLKRKANAYKMRAVSEVDVIEATANRDKAKASISGAHAAVEIASQNLSYTKIEAPISGRIDRHLVDEGNLVGSGGDKTLLTTIVSDMPIYVYFDINERDLLLALEKQRKSNSDVNDIESFSVNKHSVFIGLSNEDGYPHEGYIDYMDNAVNSSTGTIGFRGVFQNSDHIMIPGLFVRIRIPVNERKGALLVINSALSADQSGKYLLTVNSKNVVERKTVKTGQLFNGMRVIRQGITVDDRVVVNGIQRARPGLTVVPVLSDPDSDKSDKASSNKASSSKAKSSKIKSGDTGKSSNKEG